MNTMRSYLKENNNNNTNNKIIILSAHCDDIPLSLGGCLLGKLFKVQPTVIVIFSVTNYVLGNDGSMVEEEVTRIRMEEEKSAGKIANYNIRFLNFKDAICRPNYIRYSDLFYDHLIIEDPVYPLVKKAIFKVLNNHEGLICSPLGIGNHVDHEILTKISLDLLIENPELPILFYEDLPYADYIPQIQFMKKIEEINQILSLKSYLFKNFNINDKVKLLKIYKTQLDQKQIDMIIHYWDSVRKGERIWLTKAALKLINNDLINLR